MIYNARHPRCIRVNYFFYRSRDIILAEESAPKQLKCSVPIIFDLVPMQGHMEDDWPK